MRTQNLKPILKRAAKIAGILVSGALAAFGQQQINLTAGPTTVTMPDGSGIPMWGYSCGEAVNGSLATCAKLNPAASGWSPIVITIPSNATGGLAINLKNSLPSSVPTSIMIVGQLGGGLGTTATSTPSPVHSAQPLTWPVAGGAGDPTNTPPAQGPRVQSFSSQVAAGASTLLPAWTRLRPGTYLLESGTHPSIQGPMGLYGMLVVTTAPVAGPPSAPGTAYPGVSYGADIPILFSEIDPVQNKAVATAVATPGFSETAVWSGQPGGCGNPSSSTYNTCYPPAVNYTPLYYLINGVAFDKTHATTSLFPVSPTTGVIGSVLVRMVNAGLRMHVPSIVGSQTGANAVPGVALIAEDGNPLPGTHRVQSEVFMAAGKTYDVMINLPAAGASALPIYDRELSLSANKIGRDSGMLAYISVNGAALPALPSAATTAHANADIYNSVIAGKTLTIADSGKGVIANDVNIFGVALDTTHLPTKGTLTLNTDGTFTYVANGNWSGGDSFGYCGNGATSGMACTTVTLGAAPIESSGGITVNPDDYTSVVATALSIKSPGVLLNDTDGAGYPLTVSAADVTPVSGPTGWSIAVDANGGFLATVPAHTGPVTATFTYKAKNSQGTLSANAATVTLTFPAPSNVAVTLVDGKSNAALDPQDYRWIIEEDRTWYQDPNCTSNPLPAGCPGAAQGIVPAFGTNFHTSHMPVVAEGCTGAVSCEQGQTVLDPTTGTHVNAACDMGNGICRGAAQKTAILPGQTVLNPAKRYYLSVLPGDAIDSAGGHAMGGAELVYDSTAGAWKSVNVIVEPAPLPTATVTAFVFEDDFPLNGEQDAGGGVDVLAPNEPGLGGFQVYIYDNVGQFGDAVGQMTYDMFNMPLSNALAGTIDPATGFDACPISPNARKGVDGVTSETGITGMLVTCPYFESDGKTASPLAGQVVVRNLPPGFYGIEAMPGADRIGRGEQWIQTNTLDGGFAHDSFIKASEPSYFQEYGPAGFHVVIGFANPAIINGRKPSVCANRTDCNHTVKGKVTLAHMSRTPDERNYSSSTNDAISFTQTYVSLGSPDGADFAFTPTNPDGTWQFNNMPGGDWRITVFDQWTDLILDGYTTPVRVNAPVVDMGDIAPQQWRADIYTRTFFDTNGDGVSQDNEPGLSLVPINIRYRDGSISNFNSTDLEGSAAFNEVFPTFAWYVVEADTTRYKNTGTHVVYDSGGPVDGSPACGQPGIPDCGNSTIGKFLARTKEDNSVPADLRVPGSVYCDNADCSGFSIANGPDSSASANLSTGRIDPPWVLTQGWQGMWGQANFLEFGKKPFAEGENGGIHGHVVYASTRPFDDPALLLQNAWEPLVPGVTINLYQEGTAPDGSQSLKLVDTTKTSSWDDWAQGFRRDANGNLLMSEGGGAIPNMNCPGQGTSDPFYFTIYNQPLLLDLQSALQNATTPTPLAHNSQYKCYDDMHNWNQLQPAPYNGFYQFPSVTNRDPHTGKPSGTNCTICVSNPATDWDAAAPMLPEGKYVVEIVVPPGYELVKEEDKNILMGDAYVAPVTQEFAGLGNIFIMPDQAEIAASYNPYNPQNPTTTLGRSIGTQPSHEGDTGQMEEYWPCVGAARIVPDYMSLYPQFGQIAPFAGATRNLCDRKEVVLDEQMSVLAKFYIFTSTHIAGHINGIITDDFTSEFDPFSPAFGEKFQPPYLPVGIRDWAGKEVSRVYTDQWGMFNGLAYSTWGVNPPDPSGYVPQTFVMCMNDRGDKDIPDPLYNDSYSQFCYEWPVMPGQTAYLDTPVVPNTAFSEGYNHPDCEYPDLTPAISQVNSQDGVGPWVSQAGHTLTITALGDQQVPNYGYSGPSATSAPFNNKTVKRHYGFGDTQGTGSVKIGGVTTAVNSWSDGQIVVTVPNGVPVCAMQQQQQYGGPTGAANAAKCGELVITAANGKQSIDTVTVTIGGKTPTRLTAGQTIQSAIDAAAPGDLIIVPPGSYKELLLMWKPVRLQGVGGVSSIINGDTHPSGVIDPWRRQVNCLFGLALNGQPYTSTTGTNPYDSDGTYSCPGAGWKYFAATPNNPQVDRIPAEGILGWDTTVNGNLAEMLQEPTLMGSYEGAGITVLSKGVRAPASTDVFGIGSEAAYPAGTTLLTGSNRDCGSGSGNGNNANPFPSNFQCNPSSIDGLGITNSSQGGGGIYVHGWGHNVEIANNRVHDNNGTLTGGIQIGQGEFGEGYIQGDADNPVPGSCQTSTVNGTQLPYCFNTHVNIHNNSVTRNSSTGDELFSSTPAGAGGLTLCHGSDYYKLNYNWICGNMSSGDGGGVAHLGISYNGDIEHNTFLFNQTTNPTLPTNGGGLVVMGAAPDGSTVDPTTGATIECGSLNDVDCVPGLPDGAGPGLLINANLFMGNAADAGSGGGIRFQNVNGTDVTRLPLSPNNWYEVNVTNNIIVNNVAGWDGAGVSLLDSLKVNLINNTIVSNDTTASSGTLFTAYFAGLGSDQSPPQATCTDTTAGACTASQPQPAGVGVSPNSAQMTASLPANIVCPAGHTTGLTNPLMPLPVPNGDCRKVSYPILYNNLIWENRAFHLEVGAESGTYLQSIVTLHPTLNQPSSESTAANGNGTIVTGGTGACVDGASYWDVGVRGDRGPTDHSSGFTLIPVSSVLTNLSGGYTSNHNSASNPTVLRQYCNGSRMPPEFASGGYQVPPGTNEGTVPVPVFSLLPAATVDEGNNWINMKWGPLAMTNPVTNTELSNYTLASGSPSINYVTLLNSSVSYIAAPSTDFFGNPRKNAGNTAVDVGAVEFQGTVAGTYSISVNPTNLAFGAVLVNQNASLTLTVTNTGNQQLTTGSFTFAPTTPFTRNGGTCNATLNAGANCTVIVRFAPTTSNTFNATLTIAYSNGVSVPVSLSGSAAALTVTPASLDFGSVGATNPATASVAQTLTLRNASGSSRSISGITFTGPFSRATAAQGGTGSCGTTLANNATCTINVVFSPTAVQSYSGTATITVNGGFTVGNSPVSLTGVGATPSRTATLTPTTWTPSQTRNCPGSGLGVLLCAADPTQAFTLTNTGNVNMTGIAQGALSGANTADFTVVRLLSNCGPTGNGQIGSNVTLAPGATCAVTVGFRPLTSEAAGPKTTTVNVTDSFGTQSVTINATSN
jgi:hypothetical protein